MVNCSSYSTAIRAISAYATSPTHGYVLHVVTMHAIYRRHAISNYPDLFDPRYSLFAKANLHAQSESVLRLFECDLDPGTLCIAGHASSIACNKGGYYWVCRVKDKGRWEIM